MSASEVENITGLAMKDVEVGCFPLLSKGDFEAVISNDASIGHFIDTSIRSVFVGHGSAQRCLRVVSSSMQNSWPISTW